MSARIRIEDLDPATRKKLKLGATTDRFTKDIVSRHAIKVLAVIDGLARVHRRRVLEHALRMNHIT